MVDIDFLPQTGFVFMLVFSRLGTMIMLMPALGEASIPPRVRLIFALLLTGIMMPLVSD
jgi:flagellar biosynthetic protein FliR